MNKIFLFLLIIGLLNAENNVTIYPDFVKPECEEIYTDYQFFLAKSQDVMEAQSKDRWELITKKFNEEFNACNYIATFAAPEVKKRELEIRQKNFMAPNQFKKY